jgi:hypothetical protein
MAPEPFIFERKRTPTAIQVVIAMLLGDRYAFLRNLGLATGITVGTRIMLPGKRGPRKLRERGGGNVQKQLLQFFNAPLENMGPTLKSELEGTLGSLTTSIRPRLRYPEKT